MKSLNLAILSAAMQGVATVPSRGQSVGMGVSAPGSFYNTVGSVLAGVVRGSSRFADLGEVR